jgi:hypothetical protein
MKISDPARMEILTAYGISVCLVTKLSKKAATRNKGIRPITIFKPSLPPLIRDSLRLYVPGIINYSQVLTRQHPQ